MAGYLSKSFDPEVVATTSDAASQAMVEANAASSKIAAQSAAWEDTHTAVTLAASADTLLGLSTQELSLDTQAANLLFVGPASGAAAVPTFRAIVAADLGTGLTPTFAGIVLENTISDDTGVIYKGADRFIHNFQHPTGGGAIPVGYNTFVGVNAGNFIMGSTAYETYYSSYNSAMGVNALSSNTDGYYNSAMGYNALSLNTIGSFNSAMGAKALSSNTGGYYNSAMGMQALFSNTTGSWNSAMGWNALYANITGGNNTAMGLSALQSNTDGSYNSAMGRNALYANTTGSYNSAMGYNAGTYQADGETALTDPENSVYIGAGTRGFSNADDNSIVIGYNAIGIGANTVVLGNDSIVTTVLKGNVGIGGGAQTPRVNINIGNLTGAGVFTSSALNIYNTTDVGCYSQITFGYISATTYNAAAYLGYVGMSSDGKGYGDLVFGTRPVTTDTAPTERMRIASGGYVGIGLIPTARNNTRLQIVDGIGFPATQVASSDVNTLDDYEEGAWTPGITFGGGSVGVTYGGSNGGYYTKIGNMVFITGILSLTSKGSSTGAAYITGLPFTVVNNPAGYSAISMYMYHVAFANSFAAIAVINTTTIDLEEITEAGVPSFLSNADFSNDSYIMLGFSYRAA